MLTIPAFYKVSAKFLTGFNTDILAILCLLISVIAGLVMYMALERPVTTFLQKSTSKFLLW